MRTCWWHFGHHHMMCMKSHIHNMYSGKGDKTALASDMAWIASIKVI